MEVRQGEWRGLPSSAGFSDDGRHRFWLTRRLGAGPSVVFIMLNPSRATEAESDPTISGCVKRAQRWGRGSLTVVNLFTWIDPDPDRLQGHPGRDDAANDAILLDAARRADLRIAAWGADRRFRDRADAVARLMVAGGVSLHCLRLTRTGAPHHPLYLPGDLEPLPWL